MNRRLQKILVVQLQNLGDTLIFSPALRALRRAHPDAQIHVLVNSISAQVYRYCPFVDRFWHLGRRPLLSMELAAMLLRLRREKFDVVLLDVAHQAFAYNLLALLIGSKDRAGFDWEGRGALCTVRLPTPHTSYMSENLELVRLLGADAAEEEDTASELEFWLTDDDRRSMARDLHAVGITDEHPLVCFHPGSNMPSKRWFSGRFARVIEELLKSEPNMRIVLTGAASELELVDDIISNVRDHRLLIATARLVSFAGKTTLHQLAALYERTRLLVTVDSGPQHLAAALGTPLVVLMSAQDVRGRWCPPETVSHIVLRHDQPCSPCRLILCPLPQHDCMADISVLEVVAAMLKQLRRAPTCLHA